MDKNVRETIEEFIIKNHLVNSILWYSVVSTAIILFMVVYGFVRKKKYRVWKKDTLSIFIFTREWEHSDDKFLQELWDENQSLSQQVALLKKQYRNLSLSILGVTAFLLIWYGLLSVFRVKKGKEEPAPKLKTSGDAMKEAEKRTDPFSDIDMSAFGFGEKKPPPDNGTP